MVSKRHAVFWLLMAAFLQAEVIPVRTDAELESALARALELQADGEAVTLVLAPGQYRTPLHLVRDTALPGSLPTLTVMAEIPGSAIFTEGVRLKDWEEDSFRTWRHALPWKAEGSGPLHLFYDGAWLSREWVRERLDPWEYWVDLELGEIVLAVPVGSEADFGRLQLAGRSAEARLLIRNAAQVVLEGLTFEYDFAGNQPTLFSTPQIVDSRSVTLRGCAFLRNQTGLRVLNVEELRLEECRFQFSGEQGLSVRGSSNVGVKGVNISHNGKLEPEAVQGKVFGHALAILEPQGSHGVEQGRITDNTAGVYLGEVTGVEIRFENLVVGYHRGNGYTLVGKAGKTTIRDNRIGRNRGSAILLEQDFEMERAPAVRVENSILFAGREGDVLINLIRGTFSLTDSIVESRAEGKALIEISGAVGYRGEGNLFYHRGTPESAFNGGSFEAWALDPGRERESRFADPQFLNTETLDFDMAFESPWFER